MLAQPWSGAWAGARVRRRVDPLGSGAPWASNTKHPKLDATYPWEALGHLGGGRRRAKAMLECRRGELLLAHMSSGEEDPGKSGYKGASDMHQSTFEFLFNPSLRT